MILDASLHEIIWYTFSVAQEPVILCDFKLLGEASTYENKRYLLYGCTYINIQVWLHWKQWWFTTDCSGTKVSFICLYYVIAKNTLRQISLNI